MDDPLSQLSLEDLRRRTSIKWRLHPPDVLPLWVAEMDVPLAEPVVRALTGAVALGDTGYAAGSVYAEALAAFAGQRWGWAVDVAATALVPDVMLGIVEVLRVVTEPGDAVVVDPPVYPPFVPFVTHAGRRVVQAPLVGGRLDLAAVEAAYAEATSGGRRAAHLLCSPHNPTGAVHRRDELLGVAALAERYGVRVVVDEIHAPLVPAGARHLPYLSLPGTGTAMAVLSASKAWNLAGLKAAVVVAGADAAAELRTMPEEVRHGASHLGVLAHAAALREGGPWLDALLAGLHRNRRLLGELLAEHLPEVRFRPPEGTYLAWLDCSALGLDDPAAVFLERGRVALSAGADFGRGGEQHVRLNLATSPAVLEQAVRRMARAVAAG